MEGTERTTCHAIPIGRPRLPKRVFGVEEGPRLDTAVNLLHATQAIFGQLDGGGAPFPDGRRRICQTEIR